MDRQSVAPSSGPSPTGSYENPSGPEPASSAPAAPSGDHARDWFRLEQSPTAQLLKTGEGRKVWRVRTDRGTVIAKVYDRPRGLVGVLAWIRWLQPAYREARAVRRAVRCGIPTSDVLCVEQDRGTNRAVVVMEDLGGAESLLACWRAATVARRRELLDALASGLAYAHERGFIHADLHPRNILIRQSTADTINLFFIDLLGATFTSHPATFDRSVESLAQLDQAFHRVANNEERSYLLGQYLGKRGVGIEQAHGWANAIRRARSTHAERLARRRDRRLRGGNKYFAYDRFGSGWRATVVLELERRHLFPESNVPDYTLDEWRGVLSAIVSGDVTGYEIERFRSMGPGEALHWRVVGSPARAAFWDAHRRRHRDEAAELILGFAERRGTLGSVNESFLIRPRKPG